MTDDKIKAELVNKADIIVRTLRSGKDIRITTSSSGLVIQAVSVKKI